MDLKAKLEKLEERAGTMEANDPLWRERIAEEQVKVCRQIEKLCGLEEEPAEKIRAREIRHLECWPTEKAYFDHVEQSMPLINDIWARAMRNMEA